MNATQLEFRADNTQPNTDGISRPRIVIGHLRTDVI
jgi:hypothetical protein